MKTKYTDKQLKKMSTVRLQNIVDKLDPDQCAGRFHEHWLLITRICRILEDREDRLLLY